MVSEKKINQLRKEAETIFTHLHELKNEFKEIHNEEGEHWDTGKVTKELKTPDGEVIEVELAIDKSVSENAQIRYEEAKELEEELERKKKVEGPLAVAPPNPLVFLILSHLKTVKGDYPKSISYNLDSEIKTVRDCCKKLQDVGLLEKIPSGMLKRKKVKLKRSKETHQHHTYYKLSDKGDHLLRFLDKKEGKKSFLLKLELARKIALRIKKHGPDYPRKTAKDLNIGLDVAKKHYKAMLIADVVKKYEGSIIKGKEREFSDKEMIHKKHTYYETTKETDQVLRELG